MKSIIILGSYPPPFGGVPRHLEELAPALVEGGWEVHLLASGHSGVETSPGFRVYKESRGRKAARAAGGILRGDWHRLTPRLLEDGLSTRLQWLAWLSLGREIIRRHPVKVIAVYNLLRLPVGVLLSEMSGIPLVVSNFGEIYSHQDVLRRRAEVVRRGLSRARLLCMSRHCACSYAAIGIQSEVEVIEYGVDSTRFSPGVDGRETRSRLGLKPEQTVVLYVGRMIRDMGLDTLLEAIPALTSGSPSTRIIVAGGKGELLPEVERLSAAYPDTLRIVSDVPAAQLPHLYAAADIVVAPTQGPRACGSLTSLEGMATGKPVIAANVGGIPEIVEDGISGILIAPRDPAALARAVTRLIDAPDLRRAMGTRGRERVLTAYDAKIQNRRLVGVFDEVARGSVR